MDGAPRRRLLIRDDGAEDWPRKPKEGCEVAPTVPRQAPALTLLTLLAIVAFAGCNAPASEPAPPAPQASADPLPFANETLVNLTSASGWLVIQPGIACGTFCEPVVAVDPSGRVFVKGITYARTTADGSFEALHPPPMPLPDGSGGFYTDRHLQVAPDGALWFHSLIGSNAGAFLLVGVHVARSTDGGDNWQSRYLPLEGGLPTQSLGADRQWMAFAEDGTAYVTFQQNAVVNAAVAQPNTANIWAARSDDDGATWSPFRPMDAVNPSADQATGQPIVDQQARLIVPFHRFALAGANPGFAIAVSPDGASATQHQVSTDGTMFPALVQLPDGTFLAAHNVAGTLALGAADDLAGPWDLAPFAGEGGMVSSPWLGVRPGGGWDLVWMESRGDEGLFDVLHSANGTGAQTIATGLLGGPGIRSSTDFMHATYLDGRLLVVTSDGEAEHVLLLLEPAA